MAVPTVVIVPGCSGSVLQEQHRNGSAEDIWLNYSDIATRRMDKMRISVDGFTPSPTAHVGQVIPGGILRAYYGAMFDFFSDRANTRVFSYDWRLSCRRTGPIFSEWLRPILADGPTVIVAHSQGGLVARVAEGILRTFSEHDNLKRVIQISTPNYGSWEVIKFINTISTWLKRYVQLIGAPLRLVVNVWGRWLAGFIGTYPGIHEMLVNGWAGPWNGDQVAQDLFNRGSYPDWFQPWTTQALLDQAKVVQATLPGGYTSERFLCVAGYSNRTANGLRSLAGQNDGDQYLYTQLGDGTVPSASAVLPGVKAIYTPDTHAAQPANLTLLHAIWDNLLTGPANDLFLGP